MPVRRGPRHPHDAPVRRGGLRTTRACTRSRTRLGNTRYQLEARLGVAKLMIDRGDLKAAGGRLDRLIARAHQAGCIPIESKALHDRARVAGEAGEYPSALRFAYAALQLCEEPRERDRILGDVAHALTLVGEHDAARDGSLILAATAQEQDVRWMATIHLMELAALEGRAPEFDSYRDRLASEPLTPAVEAWYQRCVGVGCASFGNPEEARAAFVRMRTISEQHRLARLLIEADESLEQLEQPTRTRVGVPPKSAHRTMKCTPRRRMLTCNGSRARSLGSGSDLV